MAPHQSVAIVRDVNQLIDDFARAVLVDGTCSTTSLLMHLNPWAKYFNSAVRILCVLTHGYVCRPGLLVPDDECALEAEELCSCTLGLRKRQQMLSWNAYFVYTTETLSYRVESDSVLCQWQFIHTTPSSTTNRSSSRSRTSRTRTKCHTATDTCL